MTSDGRDETVVCLIEYPNKTPNLFCGWCPVSNTVKVP